MEAGDLWQVSCVEDRFPAPEYAKGAVMYQIFPDRFYAAGRCDCKEKLQPYWVHEDKHDMPVYLPDENGKGLEQRLLRREISPESGKKRICRSSAWSFCI